MTSHDEELSRNMDRITQLQDGIDNLVTIMYSTLSFLSRNANFKQLNPDIPITQAIPHPEGTIPPHESFNQNCEELVQDFLRKAKQIQYLISILPPHHNQQKPTKTTTATTTTTEEEEQEQEQEEDQDDSEEFERLQADLQLAQQEYDRALSEAESLHAEIKNALRLILDHRVKLLSSSTPTTTTASITCKKD
ncbi:hypothetical protein PGTUg99_012499 [Puccinia graminis f. sp. tritici]|uniref:Mediator of RNA polymerase II transcription subunit 21 n=1 Tax=Puccinia graminis f. sp. tritici TaxID=56615 RepID=A0A5B0PHI4_PUCGR|nr:hypothetical protein PGTUg99_012499 [Puccinia graminis f. sp. tritici]